MRFIFGTIMAVTIIEVQSLHKTLICSCFTLSSILCVYLETLRLLLLLLLTVSNCGVCSIYFERISTFICDQAFVFCNGRG